MTADVQAAELTCTYRLQELPACPRSLKSSNPPDKSGLPGWGRSTSDSEVLGLRWVNPVIFMLLQLGSSIGVSGGTCQCQVQELHVGCAAFQEYVRVQHGACDAILNLNTMRARSHFMCPVCRRCC